MPHRRRHARIAGPIVMIGFGSIGKGTLPLIERHFDYDKDALRRHRSRRVGPQAARRARHPLPPSRHHPRQLSRDARQAADRRRRPGLLRQSVGRHLLARHHALLPRDRRALYRHRRRAVARLLFRQVARQRVAHQLRAARDGAGRAARHIPAGRPRCRAAAPIRAWCRGSSSRR